jgi:hypothetical protein
MTLIQRFTDWWKRRTSGSGIEYNVTFDVNYPIQIDVGEKHLICGSNGSTHQPSSQFSQLYSDPLPPSYKDLEPTCPRLHARSMEQLADWMSHPGRGN